MTLAALILAGGQSQRMGQDKALLEVAGIPLLGRTWEVARSLTAEVWVVTTRPDRYRPLLPSTAQWFREIPPTLNGAPLGPLVAFSQAIAAVKADWILLLACDLPGLRADVLQGWSQSLSQVPAAAIAYLPRQKQGWEPLCGFYRGTCGPSLQRYVASGGRSFQRWLDQQTVQVIPTVPAAVLVNCNTPEEWAQWRDRHDPSCD